MNEFINAIMPAVVNLATVAIVALLTYLARALSNVLHEQGAIEKFKKYEYLAKIAVQAVEQVYKNEDGAKKFARAKIIFLDSLPSSAGVSEVELDAFIESAVKTMKDEFKKAGEANIKLETPEAKIDAPEANIEISEEVGK